MRFLGKLLKWILLILLALFLVGLGYYLAVTRNAELSPEKLALTEKSVTVYDMENERVFTPCSNSTQQTVSFEELPTHTIRAFVDTEDKRFFSHNGYDYRRIAKSLLNNIKARSFKQGASTISQQLIKNTHLSQEKTVKRKLQEWKLTRQLEKKYSKEEILEKYLSVIYFGHSCFGLRFAAEFYFGKTPQELDIADSAILAGLVKSPNNYSPFKNAENCQKRKISVLNAMRKNGSIDEEAYQTAKSKPLPLTPTRSEEAVGYVQQVFDELSYLSEAHGFTVGGNIQIYTFLDQELQAAITEIAKQHTETDKNFCVLDGKTHGFKACVSTVGEIRRLPGSLLKPLLVYAPAIEEDYLSPATPILDERVHYGNYSPENYDGQFHGYVSAREALSKSLNVPAVKILESLGMERATAYLNKVNLPVEKDDQSLALALGGMKEGYSLQALLSAYSALTSEGVYTSGGFIREIKIDGNTVYRKKEETQRVFSAETAYLTTDMLCTAAQSGTAKKLHSLPFSIAAKTGTVGTNKGNTDAYALSYTTRDIVGVWLGNADNRYIAYTGGGLPCNYLLQINEKLQDLYENRGEKIGNFTRPDGIVDVALDTTAYQDAHTLERADDISPANYRFTEIFKRGNTPKIQASYFSTPQIPMPAITLENGNAVIRFDERFPDIYQYKIERTDEKKTNTVYQGKRLDEYIDEHLDVEKRYVYTVTPFYKDRIGVAVVLPTVSTKTGENSFWEDKKILKKNWWEE